MLLRQRAQELGDRELLSCALGGGTLRYGEADLLSDRLAAGLTELGVTRGEHVLLMMGNRIEFVLTWFALAKLGACHAPVNVDYRGEFLEHVATVARAQTIVLERRFLATVVASAPRMPALTQVVVVDPAPGDDPGPLAVTPFGDLLAHDATPPAVELSPDDPYAIMFTSGSTGRSKGAVIPQAHGHLLTERNNELLGVGPASTYATELPLFHVNAHLTVHGALLAGARARLEERFSASRWLERVRAAGATHTSMLGVMVDFVLRQPLSDADTDHALEATWMVPCLPELSARFRARFGVRRIVTSYGTTEIGMLARRIVADDEPPSAGQISSELYEVRLADANGEPVADGSSGEILVRPQLPGTIVRDYLGAPEQAVAAFRDLWFHTGDVGRFDPDGNLVFVDRLQDRIRRRGENVASADLEHTLVGHVAVAEVAVLAVAADEDGGEDEIKACLVVSDPDGFDPEGFWSWCDERLPHFAVPRYLQLVDALPRTPTQKVMKYALREPGPNLFDRGAAGLARTGA